MKIVFAGTPPFAARALSALITAGFDIPLVLTQPDRPAGRGMQPQASAVKTLAIAHNLTLFQPSSLRDPTALQYLDDVKPDLMVVAAYGLILPRQVLTLPRFGCINIHASLLPRWRGAAPIQRAILAGDTETGITLMQMDEGLDTGAMIAVRRCPIAMTDTAGSLHDTLAECGAAMIVQTLQELAEKGVLANTAQPAEGVTYAEKIRKEEALINWADAAMHISRKIRAFNPFPAAVTTLNGTLVKIWEADHAEGQGMPGCVLAVSNGGITVGCGEGALSVRTLQKAGGKRLSAQTFLTGHAIQLGQFFGA